MIEVDTIKLLRECDAGVKMGISSIDDVLKYARSEKLKDALRTCRDKHEGLEGQISEMLSSYGDDGKKPSSIANLTTVDSETPTSVPSFDAVIYAALS